MLEALLPAAAYSLAVVVGFLYLRRRRANSAPVQNFKPTPWAEFRPVAGDLPQVVDWGTFATRVWDRTRSSVCDNHNVTKLDGGWYVFDDLAHQVGESDLSLADALAQQPADTNPGSDFGKVYCDGTGSMRSVTTNAVDWADDPLTCSPSEHVDADPEPDTRDRFQPGDWVLFEGVARQVYAVCDYSPLVGWVAFAEGDLWRNPDHCTLLRKAGEFKVGDVVFDPALISRDQFAGLVMEVTPGLLRWRTTIEDIPVSRRPDGHVRLRKPVELTSPWVGRSVHVGDGVGAKCVWAGDDLVLANGETVPAASAELHWDDVRVGDNCLRISTSTRRWDAPRPVAEVEHGRFNLRLGACLWVCKPGDVFTPANVTA